MRPFNVMVCGVNKFIRKMIRSLVDRSGGIAMLDVRILTWNRKATQLLWMALLFVALMVIVKEPIGLITSPRIIDQRSPESSIDLSFLAANQQIGSLKELIMMNNFPTNKWIVVDGLTSRCDNVTSFTRLIDWRVIVVVSKWDGYITGCRFPRCVIISEENLDMMLGELTFAEIVKGPTKLSGYLFAINQGADVILDITCDRESQFNEDFLTMNHGSHSHELLHNDSTLFDSFQHYGFELHSSKTFSVLQDSLEESTPPTGSYHPILNRSDIYYLQRSKGNFIKQGVSTCYASCKKHTNTPLKQEHLSTLPVSIGANTIGVFDSGPTIFHKNAFLSMFIPPDLPEYQQLLFRSLFVYGMRSFMSSPIRYSPVKDSSSCDCDTQDSKGDFKPDAVKLLNYVKWVRGGNGCSKYTEVVHCMIDVLGRVLNILQTKSPSFPKWKRSTRALLLAWLDDLVSSGLDNVYFERKGIHDNDKHHHDPNTTKIHYTFHRNTWNTITPKQKSQLQINVFDKMKKVCANISKAHPPVSLSSWRQPLLEDVMLIVIINYESLFTTTPYIEYLHRHFFRYIAYCGPGVDSFLKYANEHGFSYITYINGLTNGWQYMYDCTTHAMRLGMPVKGYLQIGDDTLIESRKFLNLQKDIIWVPGGYDKKNFYETKVLEYWGHWEKDHGRPAIMNIFNELFNVSMTDSQSIVVNDKNITVSQEYRSFARRFLQTYDKNIGVRNAVHRAIDIFYMPESVKSDFLQASDLFMRHRSIVEMAIPMINFGLLPQKKIQFLKGASLWRTDRLKPWLLYDVEEMSFLHPFKSLLHLGQPEGQDFFCEAFLPKLFNYTFVGKQ